MQIAMIEGATRIIGKSQGYLGLPLRDEMINCLVGGEGTPAMVTAWQLNAGASVHLHILGTAHPPVMVEVGPTPTE